MAHSYIDVYYASKSLVECSELNSESGYKIVYGTISSMLYHSKDNFSGFISEKAEEERYKNPKFKITKEHYYSRAKMAKEIFSAIQSGSCKDEVLELIKMSCSVHYTTKAENELLCKYNHLTYPHTYVAAEIVLIPFVKKNLKYVYNIENVEYNEPKDILQKYGIDYGTLISRCKSKKWTEWHQIRKEAA
jgi:hypothetical protein